MDSHQTLAAPSFSLNFSRLSKAFAGVLSLGYIVQLVVPVAREYLTLVPGR